MEVVREYTNSINNVEFGCGLYSTPWLLNHGRNLTTFELNEKWYNSIYATIDEDSRKRWTCTIVEDEVESAKSLPPCDMVFVDGGAADKRYQVVQQCINANIAKAIVMHDTERSSMLYSNIQLPYTWYYVRIENDMPWTSVCTTNRGLIGLLDAIWKVTICGSTESLKDIKYPVIPAYDPNNPNN